MVTEKETVALTSIWASAFMTVSKFSVGILTGSLGLISEGIHSLLDLGATVMTYMAVRISDKPADEDHPYGHGKIESVTALAETGLLFLTSIWIMYEAVNRLLSPQDHPVEVTWWSIAVISSSILIDIWRAKTLSRVAKETKSQALEADALHFSSDVLSSGVVLLGLGLVALGWPAGDSFAAIGVSLFVCKAGWTLGRRTIDTLIDAAPAGVSENIRKALSDIPAVIHVNRVRVRPAGSIMFVDLDISLSRSLPLEKVKETKDLVTELIQKDFSEAEVMVSTHPVALDSETVHDRIGIIAANLRLAIHHVTVHQVAGRLSVGLDLEVDGNQSLGVAHDIASQLETSIRSELGDDIEVETHIEPLQTKGIEGEDVSTETLRVIRSLAEESVKQVPLLQDLHDVRARTTPFGTIIIFHCLVESGTSVAATHEAVDTLERSIRTSYPSAWRVVGHAEPKERKDE